MRLWKRLRLALAQRAGQMAKGAQLDRLIRQKLGGPGYEF